MRYKYVFFELHRPDLVDWLNKNGISYYVNGGGRLPVFINFALWSDNHNVHEYLSQLKAMHIVRTTIEVEYTTFELSKAEFLMINSQKQSVEIINPDAAYLYFCTWISSRGTRKINHCEQKAPFQIAKEPSTKTRTAFWHEDTGTAELFTDYRVAELVKQNHLVGVELKNVILKNGNLSENIFQITSPHKLKKDCLGLGFGEERWCCPMCGKEQFIIDAAYQLHLDLSRIDVESDLYVTERIFGQGRPFPLYLISQRFYQLLKANKLAGNLIVSPVADISTGLG